MGRGLERSPAAVLAVRSMLAAGLATALVVAGAVPASAHERRPVGAFQFVVGWGDEPAFTGFKNSVQVTITEVAGGAPVTDVGDTLKVDVVKGADKVSLPLVPNFRVGAFGTPGDYRAWLIPTRPGGYVFRFTGTIRGQTVDERFTSSKTTFNDVEDVADSAFPAKDPSTGQLASRIDREVPRLEAAVKQAKDDAGTARVIAVVGGIVGLLGLVAAAAALATARRRGRSTPAPARPPVPQASEAAGPRPA